MAANLVRGRVVVRGWSPRHRRWWRHRSTEETRMSDELEANAEGVDFALVAYREEGVWQVRQVDAEKAADLDEFAAELRRYPGDAGSLGLVSIDEDFFLLVRVLGAHTRLLLSDVTAANDWPIARSVIAHLELPLPDDYELYPDEMLGDIAGRLGFGSQYDELVGVTAS